jgi:TatD DNase family protein
MIFDTHAHYDDEQFDIDREQVLERAYQSRVHYIINASSDMASSKRSISLSEKYPFIYAAVGVHPHYVKDMDEVVLEQIKILSNSDKIVAIGEIGLDYHYENSLKEIQKKWFKKQLRLAKSLGLPVIIHNREAHGDCLDIVKEEKAGDTGGVFHCYSGSVEMARELIDNNFYLAFGGIVTFKNAKKAVDVIKYMPLDRLLIETDCPYLSPEPYRGKRNESSYLVHIIKKIAEIKGVSINNLENVTTDNAKTLFSIE